MITIIEVWRKFQASNTDFAAGDSHEVTLTVAQIRKIAETGYKYGHEAGMAAQKEIGDQKAKATAAEQIRKALEKERLKKDNSGLNSIFEDLFNILK